MAEAGEGFLNGSSFEGNLVGPGHHMARYSILPQASSSSSSYISYSPNG